MGSLEVRKQMEYSPLCWWGRVWGWGSLVAGSWLYPPGRTACEVMLTEQEGLRTAPLALGVQSAPLR